ncbi:MAG TPA: ATP-binding protein [Candidatus Polarisedimenticolaceae bacterium]|nr:ATP-binding protein [Candidatus Polarisedimenticolaceae bacterium]
MAAATTVRLVLSSEVRLVDIVHAASEHMAGVAGFEEDDALNVGIAVREAVINAIRHGNRMDATRKVDVLLRAKPASIVARVRDEGTGFDPQATPDPTAESNLLQTSGRGILLIRAFVDNVDFKYREGRGMEVTLTKKHGRRAKVNGGSER